MIRYNKQKVFLFLKIIFFLIIINTIKYVYNSSRVFKGIKSKNASNIINPHNNYIINPGEKICKNKAINLLVLVPIQIDNFIQREAIRETWSNPVLFPQMKLIFMIGTSKNDIYEIKDDNYY